MMLCLHGVTGTALAAQPFENANLGFLILQTQEEMCVTK